jgi:hypothetical protein
MKLGKPMRIAALATAMYVGGVLFIGPSGNSTSVFSIFATPAAEAQERNEVRREVRRTIRRIERRHQHHRVLPRGCSLVVKRGQRSWFCGGIYYQELLDGGKTVYIIVTP